MSNFTRSHRIQADSVREVKKPFDHAVAALPDDIRFRNLALRPGHMLNALALWFAELPADEQESFARAAVARLGDVMGPGDEDSPGVEGDPADEVASPGVAARKARKRNA